MAQPSVMRRTVLAGAGGSALAFGIIGKAQAAAFVFKLGHDQPVDHPHHRRSVEAADNIAKDSGGRLVVHVFPNSQLGGDTQMLSQLRSGALELLQIGGNILANVVPVAAVSGIPFAFTGYSDFWVAMDGELGTLINAQIAAKGLHPFEKSWDSGFRNVFTSGRAVRSAADMAGLKLRVPEADIQVATFKALGCSPTPVNNNELYTALQTHLVDGAEVPLSNIETARYYEVSKYISLTRHQPTPYFMLANGPAWRRLPSDLQEILTRNLNQSAVTERADIFNGETPLEATLRSQGITILEPDHDSFRDTIRKAGLYVQWRDIYGAKAFDALGETAGKLI